MQLTVVQERDDLVERCKNGDDPGFKELYNQYAKAMYNTCLRILNNATEAEDVLQESFIEAFRNLGSFEYRTSFGGWLKQICVNRSITVLKKRKVVWLNIEKTESYNRADEIPFDEKEQLLKVDAIKNAIRMLPDGYRTVLSLYLLEGYDHEEIACILQVAESTTRSQYIRAKQKLVQILKKENEQARKIHKG
ncbi:MAG: RNA polymerase sigma factor [Ferruginibacter sp.]